MKGKITALIKKDLLDVLRDPKVYVGFLLPLAIFAAFGFISAVTAPPSSVPLNVFVNKNWSLFDSYLYSQGVTITNQPYNSDVVIKFYNYSNFITFNVTFNMKDINQIYYAKAEALNYILNGFRAYYRNYLLEKIGVVNYKVISNPVNYSFVTNINNVTYSLNPLYIFEMTQIEEFVAPTILFALCIGMSEMAATLITVEQEEKTFEVLLSMPLKRYYILTSKIISSFIISILSSMFYLIGLIIFSNEYLSLLGGVKTGPVFSVNDLILLVFIVLLIISTIFSSSLGILIGLLSKDLRIANVYLGIITVPILIPTLFFISGGSLSYVSGPFKVLLLLLPPTYPIEVTRAFITRYLTGYWILGIVVGLAETAFILYIASLIINGVNLKLKIRKEVKNYQKS
ncbi:MAG: ABC transporter permease subunit [Nitrososphaeria archaeon]